MSDTSFRSPTTGTAWVFPGQGSQVVGMGREVFDSSPAARALFEQADEVLGFALSTLCFEGPEEQLTATENAQPALLTTAIATLAAARERADSALADLPAFVAGHSLGEYSALVAGGALDFATGLRLVRRRGELMAASSAGAMAAILGLDAEPLENLCREVSAEMTERGVAAEEATVVIANDNAPGQLVISGNTDAVGLVVARAKEHGAKRAVPLKVSAAFHSPLMQRAAAAMATEIRGAIVSDLQVPLVANASALPLTDAAGVRKELVTQITSPVRWVASVQHMVKAGTDTFIEIGPGNVLAGLIKRIAPAAHLATLNTSVGR